MLRHTTAQRIAIELSSHDTPNLLEFIKGRFNHGALKLEINELVSWAKARNNRVSTGIRRNLTDLQYYIERGEGMKYVRWEKMTYAQWAESIPRG